MIYTLIITALLAFANANVSMLDSQNARLFLHKTSKTNPVVEGEDFVITYTVTNNGGLAAKGVEIGDRYDPRSFEVKGESSDEGSVSFFLDEIPSGGKVSVNVTVVPKLFGMYESTRARIRYSNAYSEEDLEDDGGESVFQGHSSSMGRIRIISHDEFERISSGNVKEWAIFAVLVVLSTVVPAISYFSSKQAGEAISRKKRKAA
mmetsp:Transcript_14790/g.22277  ORF Transcript_14790/g.22277 Transcript_14790/m.22277 type:complete len:205 (+) Transcript_14790:50-664(+)|eukprot:CAMPEP_0185018954 /NCGR_PEP_ID=MMETSP1103-20130426/1608_1 /TAXON_ID=36769 /ORGANISM="Paraphysomonas bandaiensis, Strain Caron Lab Isolate" /LENGTH=204 /DNA_ID=CAMNT_0027549009 /DNA_START=48 /DNA_END=662 /DNA_ORIENTATION=-